MDINDVILQVIISEKTETADANKKTIQVAPAATKIDIRRAIEKKYDRKVAHVRVYWRVGKTNRRGIKRHRMKYAVITLKKGEKSFDFVKTTKKDK